MKRTFGWTGNILRINLTARKTSLEPSEELAERFVGGIGFGMKIFFDEVPFGIAAFDPQNKIIFAPGPLTGTLAPSSGRMEIISKSPRSYPKETVTRSGMGGFWGAELKFAGYDALIIEGKADHWVNLWIHDDVVEFRDARSYLGDDTYTTQIKLKKELDPRARTLCIGPAGEKLSRLAIILSDTSFASGRSGFGAVMGSKNLKAIAVRGTGPIRVFNPAGLIETSKKIRHLAGNNPMKHWTTRVINPEQVDKYVNQYRKKNTGCFGCPTQCFAYVNVPGAGQSAVHCSNYYYYFKATEYYGESLERDQAVTDGYILANRLGLDTYEHRRMISFLEDLYQAGLIKTETGLAFDKIGSREFIQGLLESVALRKGIGELFADGCARAADKIENSREICSRYFPAHGSAIHGTEPLGEYPEIALMWAFDSRDPFIDHHAYLRVAVTDQLRPKPYGLSLEEARRIARKIFGSEKAIDHSIYDQKPEAIIFAQNRAAIVDLLVVCDWIYPVLSSINTPDRMGDTSLESQLLYHVTGREISEEELNRIGERVWNLARAIMVSEGRTREADTISEYYFKGWAMGKGIDKVEFEKAKSRYYQLRGWNEEDGRPTGEKLDQLNLSDISARLRKESLLG